MTKNNNYNPNIFYVNIGVELSRTNESRSRRTPVENQKSGLIPPALLIDQGLEQTYKYSQTLLSFFTFTPSRRMETAIYVYIYFTPISLSIVFHPWEIRKTFLQGTNIVLKLI